MTEILDRTPGLLGTASATAEDKLLVPNYREQSITDIETIRRQIFVGVVDDLLEGSTILPIDERFKTHPELVARIAGAEALSAYEAMSKDPNYRYDSTLQVVHVDPEDAEIVLADYMPDRQLHFGDDNYLTMREVPSHRAVRLDRALLGWHMAGRINSYTEEIFDKKEPVHDGLPHAVLVGGKAVLGAVVDKGRQRHQRF